MNAPAPNLLSLLWLIPLPPLAGAILMLLAGRWIPRIAIGVVCCGSVLASFALSAAAVLQLNASGEPFHETVIGTWLPSVHADWGFHLDALSTVMILMITGIGFLIHLYSTGYMKEDGGYARYFGYLNLFIFAMLILVLANNYALLFAGWECVGLASYYLIGFWFHRPAAATAGMKAFIVNRVGDVGLLLAILLISTTYGSVRFTEVFASTTSSQTSFWIALLLLAGAIGKSAQFPLHVWLPDAMEGPTPVSALIHAATMVTAGVYLIARSHVLFDLAPQVLTVCAAVGAFTALFAASIALVENDIKRVLAWSTVSQLGYMFLALGVGAYWVAIFHMLTHAFFKAVLFLGAGNVIHALSGEQNLQRMGGLRKVLPRTYMAMLIGALSLTGIPGFAGFFSKDAILAQVYGSVHGSTLLYAIGLGTSLLTAIYMGRCLWLAFYGVARTEHEHVHETPWSMNGPVEVLAVGAVIAGWFTPRKFLAPVFGAAAAIDAPEIALMLAATAVALAGWWIASRVYEKQWRGAFANILAREWYVDQVYDSVFVRGLALGGGRALFAFDRRVLDGGVDGAGWIARWLSRISEWWDIWIVDGVVRMTALAVKLSSYPTRFLQSGFVQFYALIFLGGLIAIVGYLTAR